MTAELITTQPLPTFEPFFLLRPREGWASGDCFSFFFINSLPATSASGYSNTQTAGLFIFFLRLL